MSTASAERTRGIVKRITQVLLGTAVWAVVLFAAAGRIAFTWGWVYLAAAMGVLVVNTAVLPADLIVERGKKHEDAKRWDIVITRLGAIPWLGLPLAAGLDVRFGATPSLSVSVHLVGLAIYVATQLLFAWAMASNRFFSSVVRMQFDRGHVVETGGPYRWVRHPGYLGAMAGMYGSALALGSFWALLPAFLLTVLFTVRTALEDRTLRAELPGYDDYARKVRWRLVPGIW